MDVEQLLVKTAFIDSNKNIISLKKHKINLKNKNVLSVEEQKVLIERVKLNELPKKCICSGILENKIAFMTDGDRREFNFDEVELSYDDLICLENNDCTHLSTFEHKRLKPILFKQTPLLLSDLNEIFVVLREVSNSQIKTRKKHIKHKLNTKMSKGITRKHYKHI